jgi:hypothetical protein
MDSTGRWTILARATSQQRRPSQPYLRARVHVRCVCGTERTVWLEDLETPDRTTGCSSRRCKARWEASRDVRTLLTTWALAELDALERLAKLQRAAELRRRIEQVAREQYSERMRALDAYIADWLRAPSLADDYDHAEGM